MKRLTAPALLLFALSGCAAAGAAVDIVSLPVKAVSKTVDLATTSQSEADEKRGRELGRAEEEAGKRQRLWAEQCRKAVARGEQCAAAPQLAPAPPPPSP